MSSVTVNHEMLHIIILHSVDCTPSLYHVYNARCVAVTPNLKTRVQNVHSGIVSKFVDLKEKANKRKASEHTDEVETVENIEPNAQTPIKKSKLETFWSPRNSKSKQELNNAIAEYIINGLKPLTEVRDEDFRALIRTLKPDLQMPNYETIKKLMAKKYDEMVKNLKKILSDIDYVAISTDGWKSVNRAYLGKF